MSENNLGKFCALRGGLVVDYLPRFVADECEQALLRMDYYRLPHTYPQLLHEMTSFDSTSLTRAEVHVPIYGM